MQQQLGELIRHLRREHSFTQTELGGEHFSKSYVSAVEREKIHPSKEALRFFADQLDQPQDSFLQLMREKEHERHEMSTVGHVDTNSMQMEVATLLDIILEGAEQATTFPFSHLPLLSQEVIATLSTEKQALYALLSGMVSQQRQDSVASQAAFEQALALASPRQRPAIFDAIGVNYYQEHEYEAALTYHKRGLSFLEELETNLVTPTLFLKLHLHCAIDYRTLGSYKQACIHYEQASHHLNASHDLKTASQLYMGLGYCTYAYIYQNSMPSDSAMPSSERMNNEDVERGLLRAVSFLVQGRVLCQVSGDAVGESVARLMQALVLLDLCKRRQQLLAIEKSSSLASTSSLDEAEEQCHQVLLFWQESLMASVQPAPAVETLLYTALAFRVRITTLRATFARLSKHEDTAQREIAQSALLCQRLLSSLTASSLAWELVRDGIHYDKVTRQTPSLLRIPDPTQIRQDAQGQMPQGKLEVYFAAGEVMEELGHVATDLNYAADCYEGADQCFRVTLPISSTLSRTQLSSSDGTLDIGDAMHRYQRYIAILEERLRTTPALAENTIKTLLSVLKEGLALHQSVSIQ